MLPTTKQATNLEVEGNTTVSAEGFDGEGQEITPQLDQVPENQTNVPEEETQSKEQNQDLSEETQVTNEPNRHARRTEKLIDKLKERTDEVSALRRAMDSMRQTPVQQEPQLPPFLQDQGVPQGEITLDQYRNEVADTARGFVKAELGAYQEKVAKYESFHDDLNKVESKYPILNADSESYDKSKATQVAELFEKASKGDPSLRLKDFVDSIMSFHEAGQNSGRNEGVDTTLKQVANQALAPNQTTGEQEASKGNDWESMTLPEKEKWMKANGFWD